ncbi:MAG TPA: DUF4388 domain-containing protein [Pyrinomonadaceae bacterium]|jgi:curved DNA-binding protein CbpA
MKGQLQEHPLAELIREISEASLSGALRLERERARVVIYFEQGEVIFAACNLRVFRLAECLRRWQAVPEEELAAAGEQATDMQLVQALFARGVVGREAIGELWARQAREVLQPALLWTEGSWMFDPRVRFSQEMKVKIDTGQLLMEGARRLSPDFIAARFPYSAERLMPASSVSDGPGLLPQEAFVLSRLEMGLRLDELKMLSGLPEAETLRIIYTLALGGYLSRERWSSAFTEEEIKRALAYKSSQAASAAANGEAHQPAPVGRKETEAAPPVKTETQGDEKLELDEFLERVERATNHYHVLGVVKRAEQAEIKRAYHSIAKRFHPDKFHQDDNQLLRSRIETAFARAAQAYETLKDKQARASYDLKLEAQSRAAASKPSTSAPLVQKSANTETSKRKAQDAEGGAGSAQAGINTEQEAQRQFDKGMFALEHGNDKLALNCLGEAARLAPKQARYRAFYGRALASQEQHRRQAETELQAAIVLDTSNILYRIMLAEFYQRAGLQRRAQGELERALSIDPQHKEARRLLESMK